MKHLTSISCPKIVLKVDLVGTNSLLGALLAELQERNLLPNLNVLHPDEICFFVGRVHKDVNLYEELNKVQAILKISKEKISLYMDY